MVCIQEKKKKKALLKEHTSQESGLRPLIIIRKTSPGPGYADGCRACVCSPEKRTSLWFLSLLIVQKDSDFVSVDKYTNEITYILVYAIAALLLST